MNLNKDVKQIFQKQVPRRKEESNQVKSLALKGLGGFFIIMMALTFLSRLADSMVIPKVYVTSPKGGRIEHIVEKDGSLRAKEEDGLSLESGFRIKEIHVEEGDTVKKGDALLELDAKELKEKLESMQNDLKKLQLQYKQQQLEAGSENDANNVLDAQKKLERLEADKVKAIEDEERKIKRAEDKANKAQLDYEEALKDFETFKTGNLESQIKKAEEEVAEAKKNVENQKYEQGKALEKAELALKEAKENLWLVAGQGTDATAALQAVERAEMDYKMIKSDWERTVKDAEDKLKKAQDRLSKLEKGEVDEESLKTEEQKVKAAKEQVESAEGAVEDAKLNQEDVIKQYERQIEDARLAIEDAKGEDDKALENESQAAQKHHIQLQMMQVDLGAKEKEIQKMQDLVAQGGTMKAPADGMVAELKVKQGETTTGGNLLTFIPDISQYLFEAELTSEEAEGIKIGDTATLKLDGKNEPIDAVIENMVYSTEGDSGKQKVKVIVQEGMPGMKGTMKIDKTSKKFQTVIPIEALREENGNKYVLVARVRMTTLGERVVAERIDVMERDKNTSSVAVQGAFNPDDSIITKSNKPIQAGDRIRLMEE